MSQPSARSWLAEEKAWLTVRIAWAVALWVRLMAPSGPVQRPAGWYPLLFFEIDDAQNQDTIVADVHTQPADAAGIPVGKILHVGTSFPCLMVTTFETCSGPRAYAGIVSSYLEQTTENFNRLTDAAWTSNLSTVKPVPWLDSLVAN